MEVAVAHGLGCSMLAGVDPIRGAVLYTLCPCVLYADALRRLAVASRRVVCVLRVSQRASAFCKAVLVVELAPRLARRVLPPPV